MTPVSGTLLSRAAIQAGQLAQLRTLLDRLVPANSFYTRKLSGAGVPPAGINRLSDYSAQVPFTTKSEVAADQLAQPPYGTNLTFPLEDYTRCHQTSGTSGTPLRWLDTPASWEAMVESWLEVYRAAGVTRRDRVFFAFSFGPFIGFWLAFDAAQRLGALCLPAGGLSSAARLRLLLDQQVTVLCCTPTYALRLAEVAATEAISLSASMVHTLIVAGEPGGSIPATRARLEQLWLGARVFDHHGMTEVGPVTYQCPAQPGVLHVMESAYFAEVIDPVSGQPALAQATGELVLTTLRRIGSPLLRYRTGDLVKPVAPPSTLSAPPCLCGRYELALQGGILGRCDDMVIVRGVNIYPSTVEEILRGFNDIAEYQVTVTDVTGLTEMTIRIESDSHGAELASLIKRLEHACQVAFSMRVPVVAVPIGTLPRFELKAKRWHRQSG